MDHKEIRGLISAVVTPFKTDGSIDHKSLADHVARVASAKGLYGIAVSGHAGEVLTLTSEERIAIVATAKKVMPKGVKLVAGIESRSMAGLVSEGLIAKNAGADMLLVLPLFDVRPYRHLCHQAGSSASVFERMDREVGLPMIVFQYPEATGCAYSLASLQRIASLRSVVGIKAATVTATKYAEINDALNDKVCSARRVRRAVAVGHVAAQRARCAAWHQRSRHPAVGRSGARSNNGRRAQSERDTQQFRGAADGCYLRIPVAAHADQFLQRQQGSAGATWRNSVVVGTSAGVECGQGAQGIHTAGAAKGRLVDGEVRCWHVSGGRDGRHQAGIGELLLRWTSGRIKLVLLE
jgi:hypothetical protein